MYVAFCFNPRCGNVGLFQTDCSGYNLPGALREAWFSESFCNCMMVEFWELLESI